jgi:hypothetical protein
MQAQRRKDGVWDRERGREGQRGTERDREAERQNASSGADPEHGEWIYAKNEDNAALRADAENSEST